MTPSKRERSNQFRHLLDCELERLPTRLALGYISQARARRDFAAMKRAQWILAWRSGARIERRVSARVRRGEVADITAATIEAAGKQTFRGHTFAQFVSWLGAIARAKTCDHYRSCERKVATAPLTDEAERQSATSTIDRHLDALDVLSRVSQALDELRDDHQHVIRLGLGDGGLDGAGIAARIEGMTEANVHQILSRFRKRVRSLEGSVS